MGTLKAKAAAATNPKDKKKLEKKAAKAKSGEKQAEKSAKEAKDQAKKAKQQAKDPAAVKAAQKQLVKNKKKEGKVADKYAKQVATAEDDKVRKMKHFHETTEDAKERMQEAEALSHESKNEAVGIGKDSKQALSATNVFAVRMANRQDAKVSKRVKADRVRADHRKKAFFKTQRKMQRRERKLSRSEKDVVRKARHKKEAALAKLHQSDQKQKETVNHGI